jgi:hypothetical protein
VQATPERRAPPKIAMEHERDLRSRVTTASPATTLNLNAQNSALGTAHIDCPVGTRRHTTYYYRVTSADSQQNAATWPPAGEPPASFTTPAASLVDHFSITPISSPQQVGTPFQITVEARDAAGNLVTGYTGPATLADTTQTIAPSATGAFSGGVWTGNVTIGAVSTGAVISVSDGPASGSSNSFAVEGPGCPCSIWSDAAVPSAPAVTDGVPIEVGVKFRSEVAGYITGLRFYKGAQNSGTHVGHLWAADGTPLAEATFTGETASGWQEVTLAAPVAIAANTTYIASYYSPTGYFAMNVGYFAAAGVDNPPLHALMAGVDGPNGVYRHDPGGFPTSGGTSNYWVDVVFGLNPAPIITSQPTNATVNPGQVASFTAAASGNPAPAVQWQMDSGAGWTDVAGATSTTYSFTAQASDDGRQYRAVFTNVAGTATSNAATLTLNQPPACDDLLPMGSSRGI